MLKKTKPSLFERFFGEITEAKVIFIIVFVGIAVFLNNLFNGFVWDDIGYIIKNLDVHSINILKQFGPNAFNSAGYYRPIPALYFATLYNIFHEHAFFYHLIQLGLHIGNALLLFYFFEGFSVKSLPFFFPLFFWFIRYR